MAFNDLGAVFTLAPGQVVRWEYHFNFTDAGAQFAAADVKTHNGRLTAFNQTKRKGTTGGVTYSVDIRNDGDVAVGHNLQGGGLAFAFNDVLDVVTLAPGAAFNTAFRFGFPAEFPGDRGAQFFGADIKSLDCAVVAVLQGKQFVSGEGITYSARYQNNGPKAAAFNHQGGGFSPGFNNTGDVVTIAPGTSQLYHFFFGLAHNDHGAQYASADVHTKDAELEALSHSKQRGGDNRSGVDYFVTIRNNGPITAGTTFRAAA
jgi:hypothetical protein